MPPCPQSPAYRVARGPAALLAIVLGQGAGAGDLDLLVFSSADAGTSPFVTTGLKLARQDGGPALLVSAGGGTHGETSTTVTGARVDLRRDTATAAAVFGYQWFEEQGMVGLFAGPEAIRTTLAGDGGIQDRRLRSGLRLQQENWLRPTEETLVQTTVVAGTTRRSVWARLAGGVRLGQGYVGPEAALYADATGYRKWTFGLHATDYVLAGRHLRVSIGGQVVPESSRICPYVGLALWDAW